MLSSYLRLGPRSSNYNSEIPVYEWSIKFRSFKDAVPSTEFDKRLMRWKDDHK